MRHRSAVRGLPRVACIWLWSLAILLTAGVGVSHPVSPVLLAQAAIQGTQDVYDLKGDESLGGHTLARHVGRSDAELADRLRRERSISAASTYTDAQTAQRVVARAIAASRRRIQSWEARRGNRPNLVLNYTDRSGPIGRSLRRGDSRAQPCNSALVVLRWLTREGRWIVLTSYPEVRR